MLMSNKRRQALNVFAFIACAIIFTSPFILPLINLNFSPVTRGISKKVSDKHSAKKIIHAVKRPMPFMQTIASAPLIDYPPLLKINQPINRPVIFVPEKTYSEPEAGNIPDGRDYLEELGCSYFVQTEPPVEDQPEEEERSPASEAERLRKIMRETYFHSFEFYSRNRRNPVMWRQHPDDISPSTEHWTLNRELEYVHDKEYSVHLTVRGRSVNIITIEPVPVQSNFAYELSGYFRTRNAKRDIIAIEVAWYADDKPDSKPIEISLCEYEDPVGEDGIRKSEREWIFGSAIINDLPKGAKFARLIIGLRGPDNGANAYFDEIKLESRPKISFFDLEDKPLRTLIIGDNAPVSVRIVYHGLDEREKYSRIIEAVDFDGAEILARDVSDPESPIYSMKVEKGISGKEKTTEEFELVMQAPPSQVRKKRFGIFYLELKVYLPQKNGNKKLVAYARRTIARIPARRSQDKQANINYNPFGVYINTYPETSTPDDIYKLSLGLGVFWMKIAVWPQYTDEQQVIMQQLPSDIIIQKMRDDNLMPRPLVAVLNDMQIISGGEKQNIVMSELLQKKEPNWNDILKKYYSIKTHDVEFWQIADEGADLNAKTLNLGSFDSLYKFLQSTESKFGCPVYANSMGQFPADERFKYCSMYIPAEYSFPSPVNPEVLLASIKDGYYPDRFAFSGSPLAMYDMLYPHRPNRPLAKDEKPRKEYEIPWLCLGLKKVGAPEIGGKKLSLDTIVAAEREQAVDLIKKMIIARLFGFERISPEKLIDQWSGLVRPDLTPRASYVAYRTMAKYLSEGEYIGRLKMYGRDKDGFSPISNFIFERKKFGDCVMILWSDDTLAHNAQGTPDAEQTKKKLLINLGESSTPNGIEFIDFMGNNFLVPRSNDGKHRILDIGTEPIIIRGLDPGLMKIRMSLDFKANTVLQSRAENQPVDIVLKNEFEDRAITVQIGLRFAGRWHVEPKKILRTEIKGGETVVFNFLVRPDYRDVLGTKEAYIDLVIDQHAESGFGGRSARIEETRTLELRSDLICTIVPIAEPERERGVITFIQKVKYGEKKQNLPPINDLVPTAKFPYPDGSGYYIKRGKPIDTIEPGSSRDIIYRIPYSKKLLGKAVYFQIMEKNGAFFSNVKRVLTPVDLKIGDVKREGAIEDQ